MLENANIADAHWCHNKMRYFFFFLTIFWAKFAYSQMQFLPLPNNSSFGAVFPCSADKRTVNSQAGVTNALQCRVENHTSVCVFVTAEQPLDVQSFNRSGWKFIEEVNNQYALQMDKNYKKISGNLVEIGGLGKAYSYELIRNQDGVSVNVKGLWLVSNGRMLRGAVSCAPNGTSFMKMESEQFLKSFSILR